MTSSRLWKTKSLVGTLLALQVCPAWSQLAPLAAPDPTKVTQAITIVLTDRGFREPHVYLRAASTAMLIQNRSRIRTLTVRLFQTGQATAALTSGHTIVQRDNEFFFTVQAGTYTFTIDEQPSWKCVLEVTAK